MWCLWRHSSHTINLQGERLQKAVVLQSPNENAAICCSLVGLHVGGILRQDPTACSSVTQGWEENHEKESFSLPSPWEWICNRLQMGPVKTTTALGCPNDSQQPAELEGCWSHHQHYQESVCNTVANMPPFGSGGSPRVGKGMFLCRNCWQWSGKQQPWLLELVLHLNWLLSVAKCLLCWPEHDKISLMRIY